MPQQLEIRLTNIRVFGHHGVLEEERRLGQRFEIDVVCRLPAGHVVVDSDLSSTVNYAEVFERVRVIAEGEPFRLIESLAAVIARRLLADFPLVAEVEVEVRKPSAPIAGVLDHASVRLRLAR